MSVVEDAMQESGHHGRLSNSHRAHDYNTPTILAQVVVDMNRGNQSFLAKHVSRSCPKASLTKCFEMWNENGIAQLDSFLIKRSKGTEKVVGFFVLGTRRVYFNEQSSLRGSEMLEADSLFLT